MVGIDNNTPTEAPFGSWLSPVDSRMVVEDAVQLEDVRYYRDDVYWIEKRPQEGGRCVIVRFSDGKNEDLLPIGFNARSKVHEYGGSCYCPTDEGAYFVNYEDQQIYLCNDQSDITKISDEETSRFVDLIYDALNRRIICVREQFLSDDEEPTSSIITVNPDNGDIVVLVEGSDFYSNPRLSHDSTSLCWLSWNHPDMPWDHTELWRATYNRDDLSAPELIAGEAGISICQPRWSPDDNLTFISDKSGWWNLYQLQENVTVCLHAKHAEFGLPQWVFGQCSYDFIDEDKILCLYSEGGEDFLATLSITERQLRDIKLSYNCLASLAVNQAHCWLIAASSTTPPKIIQLTDNDDLQVIKESARISLSEGYISAGKSIQFMTRHGDSAHAIYYPPKNRDYISSGEPPLIVLSHGGPTARADMSFDMRKQFWTSRGFAIIDVNYSGSTGYGRSYRERLNGKWGIRDVDDCCDAAEHVAAQKLADPNRLIIKGSSAGGYTVLCALTFRDTFAAGASYYGIGDITALASDTHKFESRYLDALIGPYPDDAQEYKNRSPINHVDQLNCPVIFFQGDEDRIVPRSQAEEMYEAIKSKGLPVAYLLFEGEGHGFRNADTIESCLNAEYYFYTRLFDLDTSDDLQVIKIENID